MHARGAAVHDGRGENIPADEKLRREPARCGIGRVVHEKRTGDGQPRRRRLAHELGAVGREELVQTREGAEVFEEFRGVPRLRVVRWPVPLMRAEHGVGQRAEFHPSREQFGGAVLAGSGGIPTDVRVGQREAAEPALEHPQHRGFHAVVRVPAGELIAQPHERGVRGGHGRRGARPKHAFAVAPLGLARQPRAAQRAAVQRRPVLRIAIVHRHGLFAAVQRAVEGKVLAEIRHPSARADVSRHVHDDVLDPSRGVRVGEIDQTVTHARFRAQPVHRTGHGAHHVAILLGFAVERAFRAPRVHQKRIDVRQHARAVATANLVAQFGPIRVVDLV